MRFDEITGQTKAKNLLRKMLRQDRIPHAQIFLGREGCGKLALALAFAQYALCHNPGEEEACGQCPSCHKAAKLIHPDLHFSYPTVGRNVTSSRLSKEWREAFLQNPYLNVQQWLQHIEAENKQGNINKDECADIVRKLSLKAFEGGRKILLMWLPEYLGKEGNRLLKLIEEPPENTLFILVAEDAERILNTILSRCQIVRFPPLSDEEVRQALQAEGVEAQRATHIARLADGNLNRARMLLAEAEDDNAQLFFDWLRACYLGKPKDTVEWSEQFATLGRENQKHFFDYGLFFMREYMLLKMTGNTELRLQEKELQTAQNLTKVIQWDQIGPISELLNDAAFHIARNAHPKILMTLATARMHRILRGKPPIP